MKRRIKKLEYKGVNKYLFKLQQIKLRKHQLILLELNITFKIFIIIYILLAFRVESDICILYLSFLEDYIIIKKRTRDFYNQ